MENVTRIQVAWELKEAGHRAEYIAQRVGVHRATVYRWLAGIRQRGVRGYVKHYQNAKKGRRVGRRPLVELAVIPVTCLLVRLLVT